MSDLPPEKRFAILSDILRAQHFAWREAVAREGGDPRAAVERMWAVTGEQTARSYLKRIRVDDPLAPQVAASIVWSSRAMGEDAHVEPGEGDEAFVRHRACPWHDWHARLGLSAEDRPGCDVWFRTTLEAINRELGTALAVETLEALPDGGPSCLRRIYSSR